MYRFALYRVHIISSVQARHNKDEIKALLNERYSAYFSSSEYCIRTRKGSPSYSTKRNGTVSSRMAATVTVTETIENSLFIRLCNGFKAERFKGIHRKVLRQKPNKLFRFIEISACRKRSCGNNLIDKIFGFNFDK